MTRLQQDLTEMYKTFPEGSKERMTLKNARIKLQCFEQILAMHDAMGDSLELAHEIDEEQELMADGEV